MGGWDYREVSLALGRVTWLHAMAALGGLVRGRSEWRFPGYWSFREQDFQVFRPGKVSPQQWGMNDHVHSGN